ncbi:MAG: hypothetical protein KDI47_13490 [Gammaproteobacteria bacterium]|nr:hypothetical protein [Gammaproteobacteria bacterium]MCB1862722.1 hypothetical protein [Gammaproteobacteria bacterium]MCB1872265.1 hypothetical protein [Gammaproteobacteria bacterium]MCB1879725.1 hypothetical protein [Gammaproteobacteria bacterium]MCB1902696.1 hypothetical protein [Gammaproteobacteria bacterium]
MNSDRQMRHRVRILLLLGGGETTRSVLELMSQLAWDRSTEVMGVFIEDDNLLRLAQMPFSRELCRLTHAERPLESAEIERQLRIQARTAQQAFEIAATQAGIAHSFHTRRGNLAVLLQQAVQETDLMILGPARGLRQLSQPVALSAIARHSRQTVVVLYDGAESAKRALLAAKQLAESGSRQLSVLVTSENSAIALELQQQAAQILDGLPARYRLLARNDIAALLEQCHNERAGTLVLGINDPLLQQQSLQELSNRLECSALLVR